MKKCSQCRALAPLFVKGKDGVERCLGCLAPKAVALEADEPGCGCESGCYQCEVEPSDYR